jgi:hypothetical protein
MAQGTAGSRFDAGYDAGHAACLRAGSSSEPREWIEMHSRQDPAFVAGYEWALFDYDTSNGVRGVAPRRRHAG